MSAEITLNDIVGNTKPVALDVQENFEALRDRANRIFFADHAQVSTINKGNSTGSANGTIASKSVSVPVDSVFMCSFGGLVSRANRGGAEQITMELLVDGVVQAQEIWSEDVNVSGDMTNVWKMMGFKPIGLTAGSHTIAVKFTLAISRATGTLAPNPLQVLGASWGGLVMPA